MTLFRNFAVLRQHYGNPFAPIQILTGDTREACGFHRDRLHDDGRLFPPKSRIERRFESQVAGRSPACFLVTFCTTQKVTIRSLYREHRGSANLDSARRNGGFPLTKLNPFGTFLSESLPHSGQHTSCAFFAALGGILSAAKPPLRLSISWKVCSCRSRSFEVLQTSNQRTKTTNPHFCKKQKKTLAFSSKM